MKAGFIGYGRVGASLMNYFDNNGIQISGVYSPNSKAENFYNFSSFEEAANLSDLLFLTITDSKIEEVWSRLKKTNINGKILCHCSGSLSSDVFSHISDFGCYGCSVHPMFAFDSKCVSSEKISKAFFTLEGNEKALIKITEILDMCGNKYKIIDKRFKEKYHCAAAVSSNLAAGLCYMAQNMLKECGFSQNEAEMFIRPIFLQNVENIAERGCVEALTGPVERNDIETVRMHLKCLEGNDFEIYKLLSLKIAEISEIKNPQRDYKELKKLLEEADENNS